MIENKAIKNAEKKNDAGAVSEKSAENVTAAAAANTEKEETELKMYVGASLPGLARYTVIKGKLTSDCENDIIKPLMIPVSEVKQFIKNVSIKGSRESVLYEKSEKFAEEMKNNGR